MCDAYSYPLFICACMGTSHFQVTLKITYKVTAASAIAADYVLGNQLALSRKKGSLMGGEGRRG